MARKATVKRKSAPAPRVNGMAYRVIGYMAMGAL